MTEPPDRRPSDPIAGESPALTALVDESAILSTEQQLRLLDVIDHPWQVDAIGGTLTFTPEHGEPIVCRAHFLGTAAPGPGSWLWGWENVNGFPEAFVARSREVRAAGEARGAVELTTAELPLTDVLADRLTVAAKTVLGLPAHYSAPTGGGTRAMILIEHPALVLPAPTVMRTMEAVQSMLSTIDVVDHRAALAGWARQRGAALRPADDDPEVPPGKEAVRLTVSDGALVVTVNEQGLIDGMRVRLDERTVFRGEDGEPTTAAAERVRAEPEPPAVPAERPGLLKRLFGRG